MSEMQIETIETDVLIIGGGGAGVRAAIEADIRDASTCLVSKGPIAHSGTTPMADTIQAAFASGDVRDNPDVHFQDVIREGHDLGDQDLARALVDDVIERVRELDKYGVLFKKLEDGRFLQVRHPGQTYPRNLCLAGAGVGLMRGLKHELQRHTKVRVVEDFIVSGLLNRSQEVIGAFGLNMRDGRFYAVKAKATVLACGGYQEIWGLTDTSPDSTGDGVSLGFQAGADVVDLEMVQYYPSTLVHPDSVRGVTVQYETLLGKDGLDFRLVNNQGKQFLPDGPLPVRDVMMRLMFTEIAQGHGTEHDGVYIDPRLSSKSQEEVEEIIQRLLSVPNQNLKLMGIDIRKDRLEVSPAMHYCLGGVHINARTETTVPGLFAAGENAANIHGANRISGNALSETQAFGRRAGLSAAHYARQRKSSDTLPSRQIGEEIRKWALFGESRRDTVGALAVRKEMKQVMDREVGPCRNETGMKRALEKILDLKHNSLPRVHAPLGGIFNIKWRQAIEVSMALNLAELVIRSALFRKETRGHHFRSDFPETAGTAEHTLVRKAGGQVFVNSKPVAKLG
jgi:fumarate reductase (CoM/CoB) subunit A